MENSILLSIVTAMTRIECAQQCIGHDVEDSMYIERANRALDEEMRFLRAELQAKINEMEQ